MNNTTTFNDDNAKAVENAVMLEFGAKYSELISITDTTSKKVVVFILNRLFGYDKRIIGRIYQMTYLYVPTVVEQVEYQYLVDISFREKIINICKIIGYEYKLEEYATA